MPSNALPRAGDVIAGKYRIDSVIGEGGMGVVLGATDTSLGRPVAIKFLSPARAENPAAAARFSREARAAASIQSEHVVRVYEVGTDPSTNAPFIVMEHLRGGDLATVLEQRGVLPIDYACDLLLQTCEALGDAHARGIVHRDLKPQNLFLTQMPDGTPCVKVLDFGISKAAELDDSSPKLTSTDMVMGTPLYMSPEQVRSLKNVDARADVWALGAILHELLTCSPPFDGPTASALHAAIAMDAPPPLRTRRPDAPAALEAIILKCLEKSPAQRFQNVAELADALRSYATPVGQLAAGRVVRTQPISNPVIVSNPPPAMSSGNAPTMNVGNASTMNAWGPTKTSPTPAPIAKKSPVVAILAALVAVLMVLIAGGIAAFFLFFRTHETGSQIVVSQNVGGSSLPDVAVSVSVSVPAYSVPAPSESASADPLAPRDTSDLSVPSSWNPTTTSVPHPHIAHHDGGAGEAGLRDGGLTEQEENDLRRKKYAQSMQAVCDGDLQNMLVFKEPEAQQRYATIGKYMCRGADSVRCERDVCRQACTTLKDANCLRDLERIEHEHPTTY